MPEDSQLRELRASGARGLRNRDAGLLWAITDLGGVQFPQREITLKSHTTNFCLDLENGDSSEGIQLQVRTYNSSTDNQRWLVV